MLSRHTQQIMKAKKKIAIIAGIVVALAAIVGFTVAHNQQGVVAVEMSPVKRQDLVSVVTASGEIKPKIYVNIGANAFGKIVKLYVKEGDHVKRGQLLAQLENVQSSADVAAQRASLNASQTDAVASQAAYNTAKADLDRAKADVGQKRLDYKRAQQLMQDELIPRSDFEARKMSYETSEAGLAQSVARLAQAKAQVDSAEGHIGQARATLTHEVDLLNKTSYVAPFDGTITNLPVREGETVVVGIQNSPGSTLMTLADLSVITAEVQVDETDIVNIKLGQPAEVSIEAIPRKTFKGIVSEIGDNAMVRSTGIATTQTTGSSQEAKDFKVVVTLQDPPPNLRPGLSTTARVTTATRNHVLTIPIQALTIRQPKDLHNENDKKGGGSAVQAGSLPASGADTGDKSKDEIQGVFVVGSDHKAHFVTVETGITGVTDIEVLSGLKDDDNIVVGSYKVLRTLRNGAKVKKEKTEAPKPEENS
jgi:HlyD family secretion protein